MSERILNGNFSQGFLYWDNGVGGGYPYTLDAGRIKALSYPESVSVKTYKIKQSFAVNDEVLTATATIWGKWQAEAGDYNGKNIFGAVLKRPDMSEVSFLNTTKDGISGEGYLLSGADIKSYFNQYGNYELWLLLQTNSKRDNYGSVSVSEPYEEGELEEDEWENGVDLFILYDSNNKIYKKSSGSGPEEFIATMTHRFTITAIPYSAPLTVQAKGDKEGEGEADALAEVKIRKVGSGWTTLCSIRLDGNNWQNILDNVDISSYLTSVGDYDLQLKARVRSFEIGDDPPYDYDTGRIDFGNVDFTAYMDQYTQSFGWYDNISIDMTVKKYKTVHEAIGGAESYSKFPKVSEQEIVQLSEAYNKLVKVKRFLEEVKLSETYEITAARNKEIAEVIQLVESFSTKASFKRSKQESVVLAEMYEILKAGKKEVKELLGVSEDYSFLLKRIVSEVVELAESFNKKVSVSKSDIIRLAEDWSIKGYFHQAESEIVKLAESYAYIRGRFGEATEAAKLTESLQAKRTHGNVETTYYIDLPTQWDGIAPVTTKWVKSKVERN